MRIQIVFKHFFLTAIILLVLSSCKEKQIVNIYCIGDSTMADKKPEVFPETGWCQALPAFLDESVIVHNHAVNGRSSKSFIDEGRWQTVLDSLQNGDFVFIQFGHNDEKDYDSTRYTTPFGTYTDNLERFVKEARGKGAKPILFTSIVRRKFAEDGTITDTHGDYPVATRQIAEKLNVPLIDLQKLTEEWAEKLGDETSKKMYLWAEPTEQFPEGRKDDTHLSDAGAAEVAKLAMHECRRQKLAFSDKIKVD